MACIYSAHANLFVNEIDYDTVSTDNAEWIELAGTAGQSLAGFELVLIDQDGSEYGTIDLTPSVFTFTDETGTGWGWFVLGLVEPAYGVSPDFTPTGWTANEIQNGTMDSIQLRQIAGSVNVHLIDYEGNNPNTTEDQFTSFPDSNTSGQTSLYLTGIGNDFSSFSFENMTGAGTPGALNSGQTITVVPEPNTVVLLGIAFLVMKLTRRRF